MRLNFVESNARGDKVRSAHFLHGIDSRGKGLAKSERDGERGEGEESRQRKRMLSLFMHMYALTQVSLALCVSMLTRK